MDKHRDDNRGSDKTAQKKEKRKVIYGITLISQVGISMIVPIFLCVAVGVIIGDRTGSDWAVPIAILSGIFVAFRNVFILTKKMYFKDYEKENKELQYFEDLRKEREGRIGK